MLLTDKLHVDRLLIGGGILTQDVVRTNGNLSLCKKEEVREMMITLLFIYAKNHPEMAYKQVAKCYITLLYYS